MRFCLYIEQGIDIFEGEIMLFIFDAAIKQLFLGRYFGMDEVVVGAMQKGMFKG